MHSLSPVFCHLSHLPSRLSHNDHDGIIDWDQAVQKCSLCFNPTSPRESYNIGMECFLEELKLMSHALKPASNCTEISGQSTRSGSDASSIGGKEDIFFPFGLSVPLPDHRCHHITNESFCNDLIERPNGDTYNCPVKECMPCSLSVENSHHSIHHLVHVPDGGKEPCGNLHSFKENHFCITVHQEHAGDDRPCGFCSSRLESVGMGKIGNPYFNLDCSATVQSSGSLRNGSQTLIASSQRASNIVSPEKILASTAAAESGTALGSSGTDYMCVLQRANKTAANRTCELICCNDGRSAKVFPSDTRNEPSDYYNFMCSCDARADESKGQAFETPTPSKDETVKVSPKLSMIQHVSGPTEGQQNTPPVRGEQEQCTNRSDNFGLDSSNCSDNKVPAGGGRKAGGDDGGKGNGNENEDSDVYYVNMGKLSECGEPKALLAACSEYAVLDPEEDSLAVETMWHLEAVFTSIDPNSTFRIHGPLKYALATRYLPVEVSWNTKFPQEFALAELSVHLRKMRYLFKCELLKAGPRPVYGSYQSCEADDAIVGDKVHMAEPHNADEWDVYLVRTGNTRRSEMQVVLASQSSLVASPVLRVMDTVGGRVYDVTVSNATSCAISSLLSRYMRFSPVYSRLSTLLIIWAARRILPLTLPQYSNGNGQVSTARHQVRTSGQLNGSPTSIMSAVMVMMVHFLQSYVATSFPTSTSLLLEKDLQHSDNHGHRSAQHNVAEGQRIVNLSGRNICSNNHEAGDEKCDGSSGQCNHSCIPDKEKEATTVTNLFWKFFVFYAKILVPPSSAFGSSPNNVPPPYLVCIRHRLNRSNVKLDGNISEFPPLSESTRSEPRRVFLVRDPFLDRDLAADFTPFLQHHLAVEICRAARLAPSHELSSTCEARRVSKNMSCTDGNVPALLCILPGLASNINAEALMAVGVVSVNNSVSQSRGSNPSLNVEPLGNSDIHCSNGNRQSALFHGNNFDVLNFDAAWQSAENVDCRLGMRTAHIKSYRDMQKQLELSNTLQGLLAEKLRVYRNEVWWLERKLDSQLQANPNPFSKPSSSVPFASVGHSSHIRPPNLNAFGRRTSASQHQQPGSFYQSAIHNNRRAPVGSVGTIDNQNLLPGSNTSTTLHPKDVQRGGKQLHSASADSDLSFSASMHHSGEYSSSSNLAAGNRKPPQLHSHQQSIQQQHGGGSRRGSQSAVGNVSAASIHIPVEEARPSLTARPLSGRDCFSTKKGVASQQQHINEPDRFYESTDSERQTSENKERDTWPANDYNRCVTRAKAPQQDTFMSGGRGDGVSTADHSGGQY
eukprot:Lankesteria_metandrocarpae@DN5367_c0_g1_i37.p1